MGFSSDIMHDFVSKEIRSLYSSYDGWKATDRSTGSGYDRIAVLERRVDGHRECVKILVTFAHDVSAAQISELCMPESTNDGTLTRSSYAVMVPANAGLGSVPQGIPVLSMRSFAFEGKELAWVKKPVRKEEAAKAPA
ncbi:MAG: hypothetical protein CVV32_11540 [Methanomicrobiales archaeon HGW-Methanomicrobiales-3]|jgi:hypothetical protein|nr:MAG: hypothetical protein CVV32_11540 [Methanomicrobiales archaeon HGW-Methanomicrobiales-3]